jgi:membrane-bound ClpP family serine protease
MSVGNRWDQRDGSPRPNASPWGAPPSGPVRQRPTSSGYFFRNKLSVLLFAVICLSVGIRMYKDLSGPDAWAYWKDQYISPSLTSQLTTLASLDGSGRRTPALIVRGTIGPAAASWLRDRIEESHLKQGDAVVLSSPGGDLGQAIIMGETIRSRGLNTAVGTVDGPDEIAPSY